MFAPLVHVLADGALRRWKSAISSQTLTRDIVFWLHTGSVKHEAMSKIRMVKLRFHGGLRTREGSGMTAGSTSRVNLQQQDATI